MISFINDTSAFHIFKILTVYVQRLQPSEPLCTPIYAFPSSVDFATRVAKAVVRKGNRPTYVSWSGSFGIGGAGVDEEMEGLKLAVQAVLRKTAGPGEAPFINGYSPTP